MFLPVRVTPVGIECCSVLQCAAVCCSVLQCAAVCCSVLQCVAVCCTCTNRVRCSVLQCVAVCIAEWYSVLQWHRRAFCLAAHSCTTASTCVCVAVCCSVLQCDTVCCSVLQWHRRAFCVAARSCTTASTCVCVAVFVAVCCSVLQCDTVWYSVLQCVAVTPEGILRSDALLHDGIDVRSKRFLLPTLNDHGLLKRPQLSVPWLHWLKKKILTVSWLQNKSQQPEQSAHWVDWVSRNECPVTPQIEKTKISTVS